MEKKRFDMYLSMRNPLQKKTWDLLQSIPAGERTNTVCQAICGALGGRLNREAELDSIRDMLREVVREELRNAGAIPASRTNPRSESVRQVSNGAIDYLRALNCPG